MIPDKLIDEFVTRARETAGANLQSIILYGSAVSGEYDPEFSNINMFCLLRDSAFSALTALQPLAKWWHAQRQPPPLLMTADEFRSSADVFPIEYIDMQLNHRILFGDDILAGLQISSHLHRSQVEYELREKLLLLRQHVTLADGNERQLRDLLLRSASSIVTLFRHALIALGNSGPMGKREAVQALAQQVGFDPAPIMQALDLREHRSGAHKLDLSALFAQYLLAAEKVIAAVDQAVC